MTNLLESPLLVTLSREQSVRGVLVRMVLEQAEHAGGDEKILLENALQLLLSQFQTMEGAVS
jgi:hypothetical protein